MKKKRHEGPKGLEMQNTAAADMTDQVGCEGWTE